MTLTSYEIVCILSRFEKEGNHQLVTRRISLRERQKTSKSDETDLIHDGPIADSAAKRDPVPDFRLLCTCAGKSAVRENRFPQSGTAQGVWK